MSNENEKQMIFDSIKIGLASPEKILKWSYGEVTRPETINYRTLKPEPGGLYCERIFGPTKDWECFCGKYKRVRNKGKKCENCGVDITLSKVRRERMGHIKLAAPVSHIWYFKGVPSKMGTILETSPKELERVLYFSKYIVLDPGKTNLAYKEIITEQQYRDAIKEYGPNSCRVGMGAEAVKELLEAIDVEKESEELQKRLAEETGQKKAKIIKKLEVVESFRLSGNRPEWMILTVLPVIPPDLRPMVQLEGGRFATSDLNDLYRRVINRNNRLQKLIDYNTPDIIIRNEKRMLQEAVDSLIDNGKNTKGKVTGPGNRALKSLSDLLRGKQGRFRQNLLGKRVDYSGRSVIVVGPTLKIYQCGLPKEMAIELFKPFVMKKLISDKIAENIKGAKKMVEQLRPEVWDVLESVIKEHPVMLNRAPTLHRLGIQAFEPVLVEGRALKLHPLVCTAYNADFDGDQMAVHVPLSVEAQAECRFLLLSPNNLLKPSDGEPVAVPSQDMVLGIYYLTLAKDGELGEGKVFVDENEVLLAYDNKVISLHAKIKVRRSVEVNGEVKTGIVETTCGRIIFNEIIPQDLGFVDRTIPGNELKYEIDFLTGKKELGKIINRCIHKHPSTETSEVLDDIKSLGYKFSTRASLTVSVSDMKIPDAKYTLLAEGDERVNDITKRYRRGLMTDRERHDAVIKVWEEIDKRITDALIDNLGQYNDIYMMAVSGARGSNRQIKQLAGMRGLMASPSGETIELPIKANFREGLTVQEYFISAHGARKGLTDTALKTADSGYLTRRLVDVAQDLIIKENDCAANLDEIPYMEVKAFMSGNETIEGLLDRIKGRYSAEDIVDPQTGKLIVPCNTLISPDQADAVIAAGITKVKIRTILTCKCPNGICSKCYGSNMASSRPVRIGEAVGIIAAQSIGEPGTQLTMRTFHTGGISGNDLTQGLPRVEELFEARNPKGRATIAEFGGTVTVNVDKVTKKEEVIVVAPDGREKSYSINYGSRVCVLNGDVIEDGDRITEGSIHPQDILRINGVRGVQDYILKEVQRVYRLQGVDINDKHIEVIVRQMLKRVKVETAGDTGLLPGFVVDWLVFEAANEKAIAEGKEPATGTRTLLGITKASLATDSFLSAASFQETTKVLTDAAVKGKTDPLVGLKENVIIGKLIPAGTGMTRYRKIDLKLDKPDYVDEAELAEMEAMEFVEETDEIQTTDTISDEVIEAALNDVDNQ